MFAPWASKQTARLHPECNKAELPSTIGHRQGTSPDSGYSVGYCAGFAGDLQSPQMAQHSTTLKVGDRAPDFSLASANGMGEVSLGKLRERGPVVVEFLRGTW